MILDPAPVLTAALAVPRPACVVDARLALARLGLLAVSRLGQQVQLWLPAELLHVVRDTSGYPSYGEQLSPTPGTTGGPDLADVAAVRTELGLWRTWWREAAASGPPLHFLGDRADESHTPPGADRGLAERCQQLQRGLDRLAREAGRRLPFGPALAACFRDATALAAALQGGGALVLTRREGTGTPLLVEHLRACGVHCGEAAPGGRAAALLGDHLVRCGVDVLAWSGLRLAAVHVAVPGYPVAGGADARLDDATMARVWTTAEIHWYGLP